MLAVDLSVRVAPHTSFAIVAIFRLFIRSGFDPTIAIPAMRSSVKECQELLLGCVMAALFYAERQIVLAGERLIGNAIPSDELSLGHCERLFEFSKGLAFNLRDQMLSNAEPDLCPPRGATLH